MSEQERQLEYEAEIIASIFTNYGSCKRIRDIICPEDFTVHENRQAFILFCKSGNEGEYHDLLLKNKLARHVTMIVGRHISAESMMDFHVEKLKQFSKARRLRQTMSKLLSAESETLYAELSALVEKERKEDTYEIDNLPLKQVEEAIAELENTDTSSRLFSGWPSLDTLIHGFRQGNISIMGAVPSAGKTAMALNIALKNMGAKRIVFFSLEMGATQLWERLLSNGAEIPYGAIVSKRLSKDDIVSAKSIIQSYAKSNNIWFFENCHTVEQQADKIIRLKPDLVIVDFLQYVRTAQKFSNGADRLEYIVSEYKRIARLPYCTCHIMVLSQYSRSEKGEGGSMFYLKGSSGIEQGGDYIFLLDRPHIKDDKEPPEKAIVKVAKNKFGKVGSAELYFEGSHQRFRELEEGEKWLTKEEKAERPWRKQKSTNGLMDLA